MEPRHHRTARSEDIAEPNHGEARLTAARGQGLKDEFADPLARAHDVGRPNCLVGADENKMPRARPLRFGRAVQRPEDIVPQSRDHIFLNQRDMLVGGGVEHRLWPPTIEEPANGLSISHAAEFGVNLYLRSHPPCALGLAQFAFDQIERMLGHLDQDDPRGIEQPDLAAQLAADRASGARDHHDPLAHRAMQKQVIGGDRFAPQQVRDLDLAQIPH